MTLGLRYKGGEVGCRSGDPELVPERGQRSEVRRVGGVGPEGAGFAARAL